MAAPHVAGVVALIKGLAPDLTIQEVKDLILDNVDVKPQFEPYVLTGGRLNVFNTLSKVRSSGVEGTVWMDRDGDGVMDDGEPGVSNWTVYLDLNANNVLDAGEPSDATDANGVYHLASYAAPGTYRVAQVLEPHWTQTYPATRYHLVSIVHRGDLVEDVNFGNKPVPGTVSGATVAQANQIVAALRAPTVGHDKSHLIGFRVASGPLSSRSIIRRTAVAARNIERPERVRIVECCIAQCRSSESPTRLIIGTGCSS